MFSKLSERTTVCPDSTTFIQNLTTWCVSGTAISLPCWWVLSSYLKFDVPGSLLWHGDDKWCRSSTEGIGVHCFGDFNERVAQHPSDPSFPAWPSNLETSPIGPYVTRVANILADEISPRAALYFFLLLYFSIMIIPLIGATRYLKTFERLALISLFGLGTYPFISSLDRLNLICLTLPLMFVFLRSINQYQTNQAVWSIICLTQIKITFIALVIYFVAVRDFRNAVKATVGSIVGVIVLVIIPGGGKLTRFTEWTEVILDYGQNFRSVAEGSPPNASIGRLGYLIAELTDRVVHLILRANVDYSLWITQNSNHYVLGLGCGLFIFFAIHGTQTPRFLLAISLLGLSSLGLGIYVAPYYLLFATAVVVALLQDSVIARTNKSSGHISDIPYMFRWLGRYHYLLGAAVVLSLSTVPFPIGRDENDLSANKFIHVMPTVATGVWFLFFITVANQSRLSSKRSSDSKGQPT